MKRLREDSYNENDNPETKKPRINGQNHTTNSFSSSSTNSNNNENNKNNMRQCPYLGTIQRKRLDFDFEKVCSVTLAGTNVYACLVCGKYFQGKSSSTPAYLHALQDDHHVFMNLHTGRAYCLPDGYEVIDPSLDDIRANLNPAYSQSSLAEIEHRTKKCVSLSGQGYIAGYVGLNNLKLTDGFNAVVHALNQVLPLRRFLVTASHNSANPLAHNFTQITGKIAPAFAELLRKMWNTRSFKDHVSPHELIQTVSSASDKRFRIGQRIDPQQFLAWFVNRLHMDLSREKKGKRRTSVVSDVLQGEVTVMSREVAIKDDGSEDHEKGAGEGIRTDTETKTGPFWMLTVDVPPPPLFKDDHENFSIPQEPLYSLLSKFDGDKEVSVPKKAGVLIKKRYRIKKAPRYLGIHINRFGRNMWFEEKNPTIVNFPVKGLDLTSYVDGASTDSPVIYNLVASICHEGKINEGSYYIHVLHKANDQWLQIKDLDVKEVTAQEVGIAEAYLQIYERV
eukprot:gb/GECH01014709.1/.p1 GENE.gb/GECH01014709.1/~~gb/GECH01014709.1/.p1  ORF type:complete len:507 (+),score=110.36 gb/GECH01014709.1/:1-1521(+)